MHEVIKRQYESRLKASNSIMIVSKSIAFARRNLAIPGDLAPSAQSMIFLANRNPYQHALQA